MHIFLNYLLKSDCQVNTYSSSLAIRLIVIVQVWPVRLTVIAQVGPVRLLVIVQVWPVRLICMYVCSFYFTTV